MAQDEMLLFRGRNRIRYGYARWGYTRGGGKTWHGGADVEGLDDTTIRMPGYGLGAERHAISGTVVTARQGGAEHREPHMGVGLLCVREAGRKPDAGRRELLIFLPQRKKPCGGGPAGENGRRAGRDGQHRQRGAGQPALCALPL